MITIGHGAGGRLSHELIREHILPKFRSEILGELLDAGVMGDLALTTDGYVVTPRFFPGGDLGRLAVSGTVNDLAMVGAEPLGLTAGFILEEGLPFVELDRVVGAMARTADEAGVEIVAGDTKVVPRGACDGMFVTTAGVGRLLSDFRPHPKAVVPGDVVITSGTLADHGMAVMSAREDLGIGGDLRSDVAPVNGLVRSLREAGVTVHALRDPTRGGVAESLNEVAAQSDTTIEIDEARIPLRPPVQMACELLGIDPLYVANEGKLLAVVPEAESGRAVEILRAHTLGRDAAAIGRVKRGPPRLELITAIGARRIVRMPQGELLPRIC